MHGYSRAFILWFEADERDEYGFVMDFGALQEVQQWLAKNFDHTLLLDADDPLLPKFRELEEAGGCTLVVFDDVSMEGSAKHVYDWVAPWVQETSKGRVWLASVECRENDKNSAVYLPSGMTEIDLGERSQPT